MRAAGRERFAFCKADSITLGIEDAKSWIGFYIRNTSQIKESKPLIGANDR